jgi:ribosome-associated protein
VSLDPLCCSTRRSDRTARPRPRTSFGGMDGFLEICPALRLPLTELEYRASRSGGPGGQHVNTSSTRVEVWWDVVGSPTLTDEQRARLLTRLATRLDSEGRLRLVSSGSRSQLRNREDVTERLREVVAAALVVPKARKRTKPSRAAKAARLEAERRRAATKRERRRPPGPDE